mmetsp:Transcript_48148/g.111522  ORF Transcript_48148/g.111522 Transcript_48148/m.111522 type:complete len:416 (-) Transcript_48148:184-1431(-)|eukprot:CAMPEP_0171095886 /NCGR_PEP_ID=MMETSP0766_2-20121228/43425_1 /TAXON_ID=439317 /ORGANISM="Gambierdiscus australes, Strain CAWD 149" /LENGTH=415 /DNA_ID=CAMNT_0011554753 /DNA_START=50 /DNA_END=1297 /DNA_ORIENTATION=+
MAAPPAPGTVIQPGSPWYGQGSGHWLTKETNFHGPKTMAIGCCICCCTCCPCGFCIPLDVDKKQVWIIDAPPQVSMGPPVSTGPFASPSPVISASKIGSAQPAASPACIAVRCGGTCNKIISIQPAGVGVIEFTCPHCKTRNQITYHGEPGGGETIEIVLPGWWKNQPAWGDKALEAVTQKEIRLVQQMFDRTWKAVKTRDRKGGGSPPRLQVVQVLQNCNPKLWQNYYRAREMIARGMDGADIYSAATSEALGNVEARELLGPLEEGANEFFLFHGTKPSACASICESDFMVNLAGSNAGTLYGPGIYFGENSSKSDEYAQDDTNPLYAGIFAMLICRVTCGRMLYTDEVHPDVDDLVRKCTVSKQYDSVLGDRQKARNTYREFIIFSNDQAYPAYVVHYRRVDDEDVEELTAG